MSRGLMPRSCVSSDSKEGSLQDLVGLLGLRLLRECEGSYRAAWAWRGASGREGGKS